MRRINSIIFIMAILSIMLLLNAQAPEWLWEDSFGAFPGSDQGRGIVIDNIGNCFVGGSYGHTTYLSSPQTAFVAKYDIYGNRQWVNTLGGVGHDMFTVTDIVKDSDGYLYLTGKIGGYNFGTTYINGYFIAKMDNDGNWLWARPIIMDNTSGAGYLGHLAFDNAGYVYMTGFFHQTVAFGSIVLNWSSFVGFVARISTNGTWSQAFILYGTGFDYNGTLAVDSSSNLYISGTFSGSLTLGDTTINSSGERDIFITKRSASGTWLWAKSAGGTGIDRPEDIAIDANGNVYLTGTIGNNASFGDITIPTEGAYLAKMDNMGIWLWVRIGGTRGFGVEVDAEGHLRLASAFNGTITLGTTTISGSGNGSIYVAKLDTSGNWFWAVPYDNFCGNDLTLDIQGNSYVTGYTYGSADVKVAKLGVAVPQTIHLLSTPTIHFGSVYVEEVSSEQVVQVLNVGTQPLFITGTNFTGAQGSFEIVETSYPIELGSGETYELHVRFTPQQAGAINGSLYVINNSINNPQLTIQLNGTGLYVLPKSPQNTQISINSTSTMISWDPVTENMHNQSVTPDYYFVYNANHPDGVYVLNGITPVTSYTHPYITIGAQRMFYKVTAVKFYRGDLSPQELDDYLKESLKPGMSEAQIHSFLQANLYEMKDVPLLTP